MDLKKVAERTKSLTIPIDDDALHVEYRQHAILTRDTLETEQTPEEMVAMMSRAIAGWDLTDGGVPVETTPEGLMGVPFDLVVAVMRGITKDINPGEANG